jgi:hypothetical protein
MQRNHIQRNKLGDKYPEYFFPNVERGKYQTWDDYIKDPLFKKCLEIDLRRHWERITQTTPNKNPPKKLVDKMRKLQS